MLKVRQILVSTLGLVACGVGLAGCGQRGPLYMPTDPAAANRATLPDLLLPGGSSTTTTIPTSPAPLPAPAAAATPGTASGTTPERAK